MSGVKQDPRADDTARGRQGGRLYKDVEAQNGKSDSNIASGTVIGSHGSAARLVTVEHNGTPLLSSSIANTSCLFCKAAVGVMNAWNCGRVYRPGRMLCVGRSNLSAAYSNDGAPMMRFIHVQVHRSSKDQ